MRLDDQVIQEGIAGTGRLLKYLGMISGSYPLKKPIKLKRAVGSVLRSLGSLMLLCP